ANDLRYHRDVLRASIVALFIAALAAAGTASAQWPQQNQGGGGGGGGGGGQHRAVVLSFSGPQAGRSRAAVVANLESNGWTVVSDAEVHGAGLSRIRGAPDYAAVAAATNATVVVGGGSSHNRRT